MMELVGVASSLILLHSLGKDGRFRRITKVW